MISMLHRDKFRLIKSTRIFMFALILFSFIFTIPAPASVLAARQPAETKTLYVWQLARWENSEVVCSLKVDHAGLPTADEIESSCGGDLRAQWEKTPPCPDAVASSCQGLYLNLTGTEEQTPTPESVTPTATPTMTSTATSTLAAAPKTIEWLSSPSGFEDLASNQPLMFLAGHLIANGVADASECPAGGLMENGAANQCGLEKARYQVYLWQNRFDPIIFSVSQNTNVPPYLLKGLFAQETQFWPRVTQNNAWDFGEYGMGQLNEKGVDALLVWNGNFYDSFCPTVLSKEACRRAYINLPSNQRAMLRGAVIGLVRADCAACSLGLDIPKAENSIQVFADTILANRSQVMQVIQNATGLSSNLGVSDQDLWRFTLVNYHAGPGCLYSALGATHLAGKKLNWKNVSSNLEPGCENAVDYVENISSVSAPELLPTPTATNLPPTSTEIPTGTLDPTATGTALLETSTATPTLITTETLPVSTDVNPTVTFIPTDSGSTATSAPTLDVSPTTSVSTATPSAPTPEASPTTSVSTETPFTPTPALTETPVPSETPTLITTEALPISTEVNSTATTAPTPEASPTTSVSTETPSTPTPALTETPVPSATPTNLPTDVQSPHTADEIVVKMEPGAGSAEAIVDSVSAPAQIQTNESMPELNTFVVQVAPGDMQKTLAELQNNPNVQSVELNYLVKAAYTPNDPAFFQQNNLSSIQVPQAWDLAASSQEVLVAVIDTGVDTQHPDLAPNIWQNNAEIANGANGIDDDGNGYVDDFQGWNFVAGNNDVHDDQGHGTHVAGIIAAASDNGVGIAGIAPNARILPIKALDSKGFGTYSQVADAIIYATNQGARIINLGFGGTGYSQVLQDAVNYALARGVIVIAAAGNSGTDVACYPAAYPGVISVSAVDNGLTWAPFSTFGNTTGLSAPGIDIYSTYPGGGYSQMSGTSMSSATVSGVAALLAGQPQFADSTNLRAALIDTAYDLGRPGWDPYYGFGLVRALDAMQYTPAGMTPVVWPTPGAIPTPGSDSGGVWMLAIQNLWGTAQTSSYAINTPANSIDLAFNNATASSTGTFGNNGNWTYTAVQDTTLTAVASATFEIRFYMTGWTDDRIDLEVSNDNGATWTRIARFQTGTVPPSILTTLSYNVSTTYTTVAQVNNARFRLRGTQVTGTAEAITIYLDEARLIISDTPPTPTPVPPQSTPTLPARAPTAIPGASDPHVNYTATSDDCAACHRSHTASGIVLRQTWPEEQVCFTCHKTAGTGTNVQPAFTSYTNTATQFFKHDVAATNGVHRLGQNTSAFFTGANRHIECEDCHEPHKSTRDAAAGTTLPPMIQPEMYLASGVDPTWTGAGAPSGFTWQTQAQREYQVCFKCHSSFTTLPTYQPNGWGWTGAAWNYVANGLPKLTTTNTSQVLDSRDMAQELNPNNTSFHPVIAKGRNTAIPAAAFVNGWSVNSMVYCADCHTNANQPANGYGPHGSPRLHLLDGTMNYTTVDSTNNRNFQGNGELCFKCHDYTLYVSGTATTTNTGFRTGNGDNFHAFHSGGQGSFGVPCYECHDTHGSEQQHLINFNSAAVTFPAGYNSQDAWVYNPATGVGSCFLTCHNVTHASPGSPNNNSYDNIP